MSAFAIITYTIFTSLPSQLYICRGVAEGGPDRAQMLVDSTKIENIGNKMFKYSIIAVKGLGFALQIYPLVSATVY